MYEVLNGAKTTDLTTLAKVKLHLAITSADDDELLSDYLAQASSSISNYTRRIFAKQKYREKVPGFGMTDMMLNHSPIRQVEQIMFRGEPIVDYLVKNDRESMLYRRGGWQLTAVDVGYATFQPMPGSEEPEFIVDYVAGWSLPGDDYTASLSVAAADKSFNDAAGAFPVMAKGEKFVASGFTTPANNGTFTVNTWTASKIIVDETTLVDEAAAGGRTLTVRSLDADLERAALMTVKQMWLQRGRDEGVQSKTVGDLSISYADEIQDSGLPLNVERMLQANGWVRSI